MKARTLLFASTALALAACSDQDPTSVQQRSPAPIVAARGNAIDGSYIVVLKEGGDPTSVAAVAGVSPRHVYTAALNGFSAELNAGQLNALQHNPSVDYIEQDGVASIATTQ